ncbi:hypothetical protein MKX01_009124 [Papaver californicum]|nr:hypothetical protein MKX01_009124 [Papaver californicum]
MKGDDSNVLLLSGKKKTKPKLKKQTNTTKKPPLSKSQKRKLEEEKEQEAKLSESVRILEKYKIRDEAFSLLKSSGNIGQEKRLRAVQFLKAGLEAPEDDRPSKRRAKEAEPCQSEVGVDDNCEDVVEDDTLQPMMVEHERRVNAPLATCTSQQPPSCSTQCTDVGNDNCLPTKDLAVRDDGSYMDREQKQPPTKASENGQRNNIGVKNDFLLKRYSVIILDEAHDRSLNTDILIGMLSRIIVVRQVRIMIDYIGQAFKNVMSIHKRLPPGGILVFVTGQREVEYLFKKLCGASKELKNRNTLKCKTDEKPAESLGASSINEGIDTKDISEACEIQGHSNQQTDRFSSYDEDFRILSEEEEDDSYSSGTESDLSYNSEDEFASTSEKDGDQVNDLEGGNLASLRAAFEALATKKAHNPDSSKQLSLPNPDEVGNASPVADGISKSSPTLGKKHGEAHGFCPGGLCVLPLYAMLPAAAQLRVFEEVEEGQRLVVVATNVPETSLTIPGIKYVVDTGRKKVKNYNTANGMETYEVQWISKASAAQRAGRAGRTGPGHSYRLYSSAVFCNILSDFSVVEISKIPVDGVVLLMKSMGIDKVVNFPFPTPPKDTALVEAERCLKALEALDSLGRLTPLGKAMSHYPMSPRHSRMLLTVIQIMGKVKDYGRANLVLGYTLKYGLNEDDESATKNSKKDLDKQEKLKQKQLKQAAKDARTKFCNPSSDALTIAYALQLFELAQNPYEFCKENALHLKTMEEMFKLRKQLLQLVFHQVSVDESQQEFLWAHGRTVQDVELAWRVSSNKHPLSLSEEELLGQAICAGWADRVAKRIRVVAKSSELHGRGNAIRYQAAMVNEPVFLHRWSTVAASSPEFSQCTFSAPLTDPRPSYEPQTDKVLCWVAPSFGPHLLQLPLHSSPIKDDALRVSVFACSLLEGHVLPCLGHVHKFLAAQPAIVLKPESFGQKRVGNLLNRLKGKSRTIDSRAMLRETWSKHPNALYSEILDWFQEKHHNQFEELWAEMHREVHLEYEDLFPKRGKSKKKGKKGVNN